MGPLPPPSNLQVVNGADRIIAMLAILYAYFYCTLPYMFIYLERKFDNSSEA